ncbi:MAG: ABC transporter ATP-binding protein [Nitratireductor sp.]|nr:ABC transporter ATP-binding protein [Nitratireductor sp.]
MQSEPLLNVTDLTVNYDGVVALDHVSLTAPAGQLYGLIGPNGSGKSTFLAAISRHGKVTEGRLEFAGRDYTGEPAFVAARLGISRSFQTVRLQEDLSVLENAMVGADHHRITRPVIFNWLRLVRNRREEAECRETALSALERVGLVDYKDQFPSSLSYGMQRRVEIARCLASDPKLLLLDEPTAGMSPAETDDISELLMGLRDSGLTQILVAHDLSMIHAVTDHVFALNFGKLIAEGNSVDVANDPDVRKAYIGVADEE